MIVARRHVAEHLRLADAEEPPDLILWGEGALDPVAARDPEVMEEVTDAIAAVGIPTVVGAVLRDPDGTETTSTLVFDGDGVPVARYDKTHLVPFGEYVPFRDELGFIQAIDQIPVDRVPGTSLRSRSGWGRCRRSRPRSASRTRSRRSPARSPTRARPS